MDSKKFLVGSAVFALCLALSAGSVINIGVEVDRDIYIREYQNASCTLFQVLFGSSYKTNETTTCRCTQRNMTTCTTEVVHSTTTAAPSTTAAPTTEAPTTTTEAATTTTEAASTSTTTAQSNDDSEIQVEEEDMTVNQRSAFDNANKFADFHMAFL